MVAVGISKRIKSPRIFSYKKSITERKYTASYGTRTEKQKAERIGSRYYSYDQNGNVIAERDNAPAVDTDIFRPYYQDGDLYWTNYGFGVVHALPRQDDGTYQRVYRWNERNLLSESSDSLYTVHYRYGADGQRALKYVSNTKISTLYFNKMWQITDSRAEWLQSKHIYVGESRIATKYNSEGTANTDAESTRTYYYHSDHLGSAQTVTNHAGAVHERLEYTPYGELWIDWRSDTAPEDATPFRFTGQILDPETGLYYYGARYLDPKTSRWLGVDPAMGEYVPVAPVSDDAKKHNQNLPGIGGVFNYVNLHVYHYAGNNPVKYIDPNGEDIIDSDTTKEQFDNMTKFDSDFTRERIWEDAQIFLSENPNGAFYRAPGESQWQQFENRKDINYINPDKANVDIVKFILTVRALVHIAKAGVEALSQFKNVDPKSLIPNPADEFSTIGPSDRILHAARETIKNTGNISSRISVVKGPDGILTIADGHHRWLAAIQMGLKKIPIHIIGK
jgi:RHS repeat-associated protein